MGWTCRPLIPRPNDTHLPTELWEHPRHGQWVPYALELEDGTCPRLWWRIDRLTPEGMPTGGLKELPLDETARRWGCGIAIAIACVLLISICAFIWVHPLAALAIWLIAGVLFGFGSSNR